MVFYPCDFEAQADEANFIHANVFVAYLEGRFGQEELMERIGCQGESFKRRWFRWRVETTDNLLNVFNVDEFLCKVFAGEVMLHDLPPHAFSFKRIKRKSPHIPKEARDKVAIRIVKHREPAQEIAEEYGRTVDCVRKWASTYRKEHGIAA